MIESAKQTRVDGASNSSTNAKAARLQRTSKALVSVLLSTD